MRLFQPVKSAKDVTNQLLVLHAFCLLIVLGAILTNKWLLSLPIHWAEYLPWIVGILFISASGIGLNSFFAMGAIYGWVAYLSVMSLGSSGSEQSLFSVLLFADSLWVLMAIRPTKWHIIPFLVFFGLMGTNAFIARIDFASNYWLLHSMQTLFYFNLLLMVLIVAKLLFVKMQFESLLQKGRNKKFQLVEKVFDAQEYQRERMALIRDIHHFVDVQIPKIRQINHINLDKMKTIFPKDYNKLLGIATEVATSVDFLLRNMDKHIRKAKSEDS